MEKGEVVCSYCPLSDNCDSHLSPHRYIEGEIVDCNTKFQCPAYACNDARVDARHAIDTKIPTMYSIENNGERSFINAVSFGEGFNKFIGMIVDISDGKIYSLSMDSDDLYYPTGQSAYFNY